VSDASGGSNNNIADLCVCGLTINLYWQSPITCTITITLMVYHRQGGGGVERIDWVVSTIAVEAADKQVGTAKRGNGTSRLNDNSQGGG